MERKALGRGGRHKAIRGSLLSAARSLLVSRSMDALSIDEIVERADVGRGTFYNYFADKDALERELASQTRARIEEEIARVNERVVDPPERITRAFLACSASPSRIQRRRRHQGSRGGDRYDEALSARDRSGRTYQFGRTH